MKIFPPLFFLFLFLVLSVGIVSGQDNFVDFNKKDYGFIYRIIGEEEGLPSASIKDVVYDNEGFFWFATNKGLIKYDGLQTQVFDKETIAEFSSNSINNLELDKYGNLWFGNTLDQLFVRKGDEFKRIKSNVNNNAAVIISLLADSDGNIWIGTLKHGLYKYANEKMQLIKTSTGQSTQNILSIKELTLEEKTILVGTSRGLFKVVNDKLEAYIIPSLPSEWIKSIYMDDSNSLWIGTNKGVALYDGDKRIKEDLFADLRNVLIFSFDEDSDNNIWITTYNRGIFIFSKKRQKLFPLNEKNGLSDNQILSLKFINDAALIGTRSGGLNILRPAILECMSSKDGLADEYVNSIYEDSPNYFLVGTINGIYNISIANSLNHVHKLPMLVNDHIYFIVRDKKSKLLIGTRTSGLHVFSGKEHSVFNAENKLRVNFVRSIYVDDENNYWIGTNGAGVCIIDNASTTYIDTKSGLSNDLVSFIHEAVNGDILVGTSGGGLNVIRNKKVIKVFNTSNGLSSNIISSIYEESDGTIWLTALEGGIIRIKNSRVDNLKLEDGLHSNIIFNIIPDSSGNFWFPTQNGIFTLSKKNIELFLNGKNKFLNSLVYGVSDGMLTENCVGATKQSSVLSSSGKILVSTLKGVVVIDPAKKSNRKEKIKVYLKDIVVNDLLHHNMLEEIGPGVNRLEINYSAKTLIEPKFVYFYYKLYPIDKNFNHRTLSEQIVFTHLPPGDYTFELIATKSTEKYTADTLKYSFTITPYFHETNLFRILVVLFLLLFFTAVIIILVRRSYTKKIKKLEATHELEKERMRISKDMHDELGAIVTKISLLSEVSKQNTNNSDLLNKYLTEISETGTELASAMDEIVWAVNPKNDRLDKLIFYIVQFCENIISLTDINFSVTVPDEIEEVPLNAEFRHGVFLIVKEAMNNIIKHSKAQNVVLRIFVIEEHLQIQISDDGIGFKINSVSQFSNGLKNMQHRAKQCGGKIDYASTPNTGTRVEIELALSGNTNV
ncbi:MAG: hypothetical protein AUK34_12500 [Ignavibacteria bacterium CG2_30_36_16]|nr:hypothetical protein [Ignavibacteria bacterium]OIP55757.1 MAG: hypothetical protein AUK34_12500 [Ignavibacteria bacterium CG2_30_36_16]PJA99544.1 MAG: hypothetical protein CO127_10260 [Ignavibacteria bacterium CG_4_9_14_3_um_filter_36_18]